MRGRSGEEEDEGDGGDDGAERSRHLPQAGGVRLLQAGG